MTENEFDEFLRNKLFKYPSPVPEDMWQRIRKKKKKDRRGFFLIWSLAVTLLIFLGGYFILLTNKNMDNEKAISSAGKQNIKPQNNSTEIQKNAGNKGTTNTTPNTTHHQTVKSIISNKQSNKQVDNNERNNIYLDKFHNKKFKPAKYFSAKTISVDNYVSTQKERPVEYNRILLSAKDLKNIDINNSFDSTGNNSYTADNIVKAYPDTVVNRQAIKIISLSKDSLSEDTLSQSQNQSKKQNKQSTPKKGSWVLDINVSPDFPFNKITADDADFVDYIKRSHKMQLSYTVGARVSRYFGKHFSAKTGLQYSQIKAEFDESAVIVNRYKSIDIPFLIGYDIGNVDFKTAIHAGVILNLNSWYKGKTITSYGVADINDADTYKHNTGVSLYVGLSFAKRLNNKLQVFTEPYYRHRLSYMTKPQTPFNQKINIAGISFGLKYNFKKDGQHK